MTYFSALLTLASILLYIVIFIANFHPYFAGDDKLASFHVAIASLILLGFLILKDEGRISYILSVALCAVGVFVSARSLRKAR
jgi:hypothetical protein